MKEEGGEDIKGEKKKRGEGEGGMRGERKECCRREEGEKGPSSTVSVYHKCTYMYTVGVQKILYIHNT